MHWKLTQVKASLFSTHKQPMFQSHRLKLWRNGLHMWLHNRSKHAMILQSDRWSSQTGAAHILSRFTTSDSSWQFFCCLRTTLYILQFFLHINSLWLDTFRNNICHWYVKDTNCAYSCTYEPHSLNTSTLSFLWSINWCTKFGVTVYLWMH